jgi:hypothetical protein
MPNAAEAPVDRSRSPGDESDDATRKRLLILCLDDQMHVIVLNREGDDVKRCFSRGGNGVTNDGKQPRGP